MSDNFPNGDEFMFLQNFGFLNEEPIVAENTVKYHSEMLKINRDVEKHGKDFSALINAPIPDGIYHDNEFIRLNKDGDYDDKILKYLGKHGFRMHPYKRMIKIEVTDNEIVRGQYSFVKDEDYDKMMKFENIKVYRLDEALTASLG